MTEKKMRKLIKRFWYHRNQIRNVLNEMHRQDLIVYEDYGAEGPCWAVDQLDERLKKTTMKQIANIVHDQIKRALWK